MKIGIPNTLFAAYHLPYWQEFLGNLGMEVIVSGGSRQENVDAGGKLVPHEFCLPIKTFLGHVVDLITKNVDLILVPRMISKGKRNFFCPKLIGLPEIVKYAANLEDSYFFSPEIICNGLYLEMLKYPRLKTKSGSEFRKAEKQAQRFWEKILLKCRKEHLTMAEASSGCGIPPSNRRLRLGLLGYAYALYDPFISKGIISKLAGLGAELRTWEMIDPPLIEKKLKKLNRPLVWNFGRILLGAGLYFLEEPGIDGVVYATSFGCGPDSIVIKLLSLEAGFSQKPFLQLTLDEHSGDGHLKTRLEAFIDMLTARKERETAEDHISLYGAGAGL
ncbi:MAG: acyl-CoA dehydratase activase-related protein [Bacillota bacterium]